MNLLIKQENSYIQILDNDNNNILFVCSFNATANPNYTDFKTIDIVDNNSIETFKLPFDNSTIFLQFVTGSATQYAGTFENLVETLNNDFFKDYNAAILEQLKSENNIYHELKSAPSNFVLTDFLDLSFAVVSGSVDVTINSDTVNYPITAFTNKILGAEYSKDNYLNSVTFDGSGDVLITYTKAL